MKMKINLYLDFLKIISTLEFTVSVQTKGLQDHSHLIQVLKTTYPNFILG